MRTVSVLILSLFAACNFHGPPWGGGAPATPETPTMADIAEDATYMMLTPGGAQCTAWAVGDHEVMTAGHCCDDEGLYLLIHKDLRVVTATVEAYEDSVSDEAPPVDACLMKTEEYVGPGIPLAASMPSVGTKVGFVGYPKGEYSVNFGEYVGDVDGPYLFWDDYTANAPCNRGASGSAMFSEEGAYGILVRLIVLGDQVLPGSRGCVASPLDQIHALR
jgi:hypothetical protein